MLEVIVQVGVANGDHQGKSFNLRSLITSTFLWGQVTVGVVVLCCTLRTLPPSYLHIFSQ